MCEQPSVTLACGTNKRRCFQLRGWVHERTAGPYSCAAFVSHLMPRPRIMRSERGTEGKQKATKAHQSDGESKGGKE